jgi:chromosome segregation ATPase
VQQQLQHQAHHLEQLQEQSKQLVDGQQKSEQQRQQLQERLAATETALSLKELEAAGLQASVAHLTEQCRVAEGEAKLHKEEAKQCRAKVVQLREQLSKLQGSLDPTEPAEGTSSRSSQAPTLTVPLRFGCSETTEGRREARRESRE